MAEGDRVRTAMILDLDGTVHRGISILNPLGYSNLEVVWVHLWREFPGLFRAWRIGRAMLGIRIMDTRLRRMRERGKISMATRDELLIRRYIDRVLTNFTGNSFRRAAYRVVKYRDPELDSVIRSLPEWIVAVHLISKGFQVTVDAYRQWIGTLINVPVTGRGNELLWRHDGPPGLVEKNAVFTAEDKAALLNAYLAEHPDIAAAVIIGDTEEDLGMFRAARERLGPDRSLTIAIHPKDPLIKAAADIVCDRWSCIGRLLLGNHPPWKTPLDGSGSGPGSERPASAIRRDIGNRT